MRVSGQCLFGVFVLCASSASAQDLPSRPLAEALRVSASDPCLTREALISSVAAWLGTPRVEAEIEIEVNPEAQAFTLHRGGARDAARSFDVLPESCDDRLSALSLAIALAIDHTVLDRIAAAPPETPRETTDAPEPPLPQGPSGAESSEAEPNPVPDTTPRTSGEEAAPAMALGAASPKSSTTVGLVLGAALLFRRAPGWGGGASAALSLTFHGRHQLRAGAFWDAPVDASVPLGTARYGLVGGRLDGCFGHPVEPVTILGCIGAAMGRLRVEGHGFAENRTARQTWAAVLLRPMITYTFLGHFTFGIGLDTWLPLTRPSVHVRGPSGENLGDRRLPPAGLGLGAELSAWLP